MGPAAGGRYRTVQDRGDTSGGDDRGDVNPGDKALVLRTLNNRRLYCLKEHQHHVRRLGGQVRVTASIIAATACAAINNGITIRCL